MLGPVYSLEWKNAARYTQKYSWRWIYIGILFIQLAVLAYESLIRSRLEVAMIAESAVYLILTQQTVAILCVAPAFAAGSITDEKRRGTLDFMLMTPLSSAEIILGKWLGQATQVLHLLSPGYFLIALLSGALFDDSRRIYLCIAEQLLLLYALTAFSLLSSVLNQGTPKAIVAVYLAFALLLAVEWLTSFSLLGPSFWPIFDRAELELRKHVIAALAFAALTPLALGLAVWRLRPSHEHQGSAPRSVGRWWDRPPVGDAPMRWKERFIGDWLSIPGWRRLSRGAKCACVAVLVTAIALAWPQFETFLVLGCLQLLSSGLFVAIRAAGAITGEKENQTWESLRTTHMDAYQIVRGKLWGQIDALRPYLFVYLASALFGSLFAGVGSVLWIAYTWLASWIFLYYLGAIGIATSVKSTSTWRSILITLTIGQASSLFTAGVFTIIVGSIAMMVVASFTFVGPTTTVINSVLIGASIVGLLWIFAQTEEVLQAAQRELNRHWRGEGS